jgi:hypothetical protein
LRDGKALVVEGFHVHPTLLRARLAELAAAAAAEPGPPRLPPIVIAVLLTAAPRYAGVCRPQELLASDAVLARSHEGCLDVMRIESSPERVPDILDCIHRHVLHAMHKGGGCEEVGHN